MEFTEAWCRSLMGVQRFQMMIHLTLPSSLAYSSPKHFKQKPISSIWKACSVWNIENTATKWVSASYNVLLSSIQGLCLHEMGWTSTDREWKDFSFWAALPQQNQAWLPKMLLWDPLLLALMLRWKNLWKYHSLDWKLSNLLCYGLFKKINGGRIWFSESGVITSSLPTFKY